MKDDFNHIPDTGTEPSRPRNISDSAPEFKPMDFSSSPRSREQPIMDILVYGMILMVAFVVLIFAFWGLVERSNCDEWCRIENRKTECISREILTNEQCGLYALGRVD